MLCNFCNLDKPERGFTQNQYNLLEKKCINCSRKCEHGKRRNVCKECGGVSLCKHDREKQTCKKCGGKSICEHGNRKQNCKDCKGVSLCEHNLQKYRCKDCNGSSICIHGKVKDKCREGCGGQSYCKHNILKRYCSKGCGGNSLCEHKVVKYRCIICDPIGNFISRQRMGIKRRLTTKKTYNTNTYIACSNEFLFNHIKSQMIEGMTLENIEIDHIKPVAKFDMTKEEEIMKCFHWSNLQPLLKEDNRKKSAKWTKEDEENWQKNIIKI